VHDASGGSTIPVGFGISGAWDPPVCGLPSTDCLKPDPGDPRLRRRHNIRRNGGTEYRVRHIGINTAERGKLSYSEGAQLSWELLEGKAVRLDKDMSTHDRYGRLLRYVYVSDAMVHVELVRRRVASAASYAPDARFADWFVEVKRKARAAGWRCWAAGVKVIWLPVVAEVLG